MKTSKRTPTAKGRRKVAKGREKVTGRSIFPFGNDIFDIIDYYYTYDSGRREGIKIATEHLVPEFEKVVRIQKDTAQLAETLQQENIKKDEEADRLQKELAETDTELVKAKESHKEKTAKLMEKIHDMNWTLRDSDGDVVATGATMERLGLVIYSAMKNGGIPAKAVFTALKQAVHEVGPANPKKDSFAGTVQYSNNSKELWENWSSIPEGEFIKKFKNFAARSTARNFIRPPVK